MMALRGFSSIDRRGILMNLIYKSPGRTVANFYQCHQSPVKLLPLKINCNDRAIIPSCQFHTTQRLCIPPGLTLFFRPLTRFGALLLGRLIKRWWSRRTPEQKEMYKKWFTARRRKIYGVIGLIVASFIAVYLLHLETDPMTGRTRCILLNNKQQDAIGKLILKIMIEKYEEDLIPASHPTYKRLTALTDRLLQANEDLPGVALRNWSLTVVNSDIKNAFVLPNGNIFVFLGALHMVENDDQLAMILAHEIAHVLLLHPIENLSRNIILDIFLAVPIALIWAMFPSFLAILFQILGVNITNILLTWPYNRKSENEADEIGIKLAAKACFDVREAVVVWGLMRTIEELNKELPTIDWLSTHPNHEDRERNMTAKLAEAIELRNEKKCPRMNPTDPIKLFNSLTLEQCEARFKANGIL